MMPPTSSHAAHPAPEFEVSAWLNAPGPVTLASLRGMVVAVYAFQMLCPGCVAHAIPQAQSIARHIGRDDLAVLGLHTVFEHHEAMNENALRAFIHEYRIGFPVGIDRPAARGPMPSTMARYGMRGTPTLLLFDRAGVLRHSLFGHVPDMQVGALLGQLLAEPAPSGCGDGGCLVPPGSAAWHA
nr:redoxin domain-containing protein [Massilia sp. ST3]